MSRMPLHIAWSRYSNNSTIPLIGPPPSAAAAAAAAATVRTGGQAAMSSSGSSGSCTAALQQLCGVERAAGGEKECLVRCGRQQHALRIDGCTSADLTTFCQGGGGGSGSEYAALQAYFSEARKESSRGGSSTQMQSWAAQYWKERS